MNFRISLLSLNVLCGTFFSPLPIARHLRQARLIKQLNPDIICLQECNNFIIESVYTKTLANTHNLIVERRSIKDYVHRVINILIIAKCFSCFCPFIKYVLLNPYIHNSPISSPTMTPFTFILLCHKYI